MVIADNEISEDQREISAPMSPLKRHSVDEKSVDVSVLVVGTKSWPALSDAQTPKPKNHVEKVSAKGEDVAVSVPSVGHVAPRAPSVQKSNGSGNFNPMNHDLHHQRPFPAMENPMQHGMGPRPIISVPPPRYMVGPSCPESMEGRKVIQLDLHQIDLNEAVSVQDPSEHSMEQQQEKTGTDIIELGRAITILNSNDNIVTTLNSNENNLIQAVSVPEESHAPRRVQRKRIHWTEDEHKLFLKGLKKHGKGRWTDISNEFVVTKTPIQIASHAQKYFIHQNVKDIEKRTKRRSIHTLNKNNISVTEIQQNELTPLVTAPMEEQHEIPPLVTPTMEQHENPPQESATSRQMYQLVLLCPIGSTLPDVNKLEKMRNLLAKEL